MTVYAELSKVLKSKYSPGADVQAYLEGLVARADKLDDTAWEKLSADAKEWVNDAVEAVDSKDEIPVPEGLEVEDDDDDHDEDDHDEDHDEDAADEDDEDEDEDDETEDEEDEAPPPRKAMKNGKNGKHVTKEAAPAKKGKGKAKAEEAAPKKGKVAKADKVEKEVKGKKGKAAKAEKPAKAEAKGKGKGKAAKADKVEKPKKAKAAGGVRRGGPSPFPENAKIKIINKAPHREGSKIAERYAKLRNGMTCAEARAAGLSWLDLRCDVERGNIDIK